MPSYWSPLRWVLLLISVLLPLISAAQSSSSILPKQQPYPFFQKDLFTRFTNISTEDGLSDPFILDIIQDLSGCIWIATRNGLNRFDGCNIKSYLSSKKPGSLPNNLITSLAIAYNGSLYIGKPSLWCILLRCGSFVTLGAKFGDTLGRAFVPNQWIFISTNGISRPSTCFVILIPIATLFLNLR